MAAEAEVAAALRAAGPGPGPVSHDLPGPTGESNRLTSVAREPLICLGPTAKAAAEQAALVRDLGGLAVEAPSLEPAALGRLAGFAGAVWWGGADRGRAYAAALAGRQGAILPLIGGRPDRGHARLERHVCIDTTASGGNAQLLVEAN